MATLELKGDASGAVRASSEVSSGGDKMAESFRRASAEAQQISNVLRNDPIAREIGEAQQKTDQLTDSMKGFGQTLLQIAEAGVLVKLKQDMDAVKGSLDEAGKLSQTANLGSLSQLGPAQLATARDLIASGVPVDKAASTTLALEGATPADAAFLRQGASANIFTNPLALSQAAKAYEAQNPRATLQSMLGQSAVAFAGTGLLPEQGVESQGELAAGFSAAGIGGQAGLALTGGMAKLFGGNTGKATQFIRGLFKSGVLDDLSDEQKNDPGKLLDAVNKEFPDTDSLEQAVGSRGMITTKALLGARDDVEQRFQALQGAGADSAQGMVDASRADPGLAAAEAQRRQTGGKLVDLEGRGVLRLQEQTAYNRAYAEQTRGMSPGHAAIAGIDSSIEQWFRSNFSSDAGLANVTQQLNDRTGHLVLRRIERNTRSGPVPNGRQE